MLEHLELADLSCFAHRTFGIDSGVCREYLQLRDSIPPDHEHEQYSSSSMVREFAHKKIRLSILADS